MRLTFQGAADAVTGSLHQLEVAGRSYLLDFGMYQAAAERPSAATATSLSTPLRLTPSCFRTRTSITARLCRSSLVKGIRSPGHDDDAIELRSNLRIDSFPWYQRSEPVIIGLLHQVSQP